MVRFLAATVNAAELLVAVPQLLVKAARYWLPLEDTGGFVSARVAFVSPVMFVKPDPVFTCHCTVGVGEPLAATVKLAFAP